MKQYIVDAFTDRAFHGNPAAICVMDQWPDEQLMMDIAMENNLSETAFIVKEEVMGKELDLICVLQDTNQVKDFVPNAELIKKLPGRMLHITAPGIGQYDCCSRCFGPKIGILEDPVCGSAHCQIIPYWAKRLGKSTIDAWEASLRGGALQGEILNNEQLIIRGNATLFAESDLRIS